MRASVGSEKLIRHQFPVSVKFTGKYFSSLDRNEMSLKQIHIYLGMKEKGTKNN
jgi:hypothetical protein